jgi:hypothetical protein
MSEPGSSNNGGPARELPAVGQLLKHRALGTDAIYRVVGKNSRGVEVEVIDAPGLTPGSRFTFSRTDVLAMDAIDSLWDELGRGSSGGKKPR